MKGLTGLFAFTLFFSIATVHGEELLCEDIKEMADTVHELANELDTRDLKSFTGEEKTAILEFIEALQEMAGTVPSVNLKEAVQNIKKAHKDGNRDALIEGLDTIVEELDTIQESRCN